MDADDDRSVTFHRLHASGCFVMPNPWDPGSARALEQMGFKALATTSAGFAGRWAARTIRSRWIRRSCISVTSWPP
jgi:2-methylisocitrate lyase-like PEP mutase family enzyme